MEKRKAQADFRRDESNLQHAEKGARWQQHAEEMQQVEEARARVLHVHAKVQATLAKAHEDHAEAMNDDAKIRTWHANTSYSIDALNNSANITRRKVQELQKWGKVRDEHVAWLEHQDQLLKQELLECAQQEAQHEQRHQVLAWARNEEQRVAGVGSSQELARRRSWLVQQEEQLGRRLRQELARAQQLARVQQDVDIMIMSDAELRAELSARLEMAQAGDESDESI
jgi:hypothetical protein